GYKRSSWCAAVPTAPYLKELTSRLQSIRLTKFQEDIGALIQECAAENDKPTSPLIMPVSLLQHRLFKELFARLDPSRIPKHPLDYRGARAITEALEALWMYAHISEAAPQSGDAFLRAYLKHLPNVWQWGLWLLPGEGNVKDSPSKNLECLDFPLQPDGTVVIGVYLRYLVLQLIIAAFVDTPTGRKILLAQPRFYEVLLKVLSYNWTRPKKFNDARQPHALLRVIFDGLTDKNYPKLVKRTLDEVTAFEKQSPGRVFEIIVERLLDAEEKDSFQFIMGYLGTLSHLLILSHHLFRENIRRANGGPAIVELLLRTVPDFGFPRTRTDEQMTMPILMQLMETLLTSRWSDQELVDVIDAGLLRFIDRLNRFLPSDAKGRERRRMVNVWIKDVIMPSMVWPKVLRAFHKEASEHKLLTMMVFPQWDEWRALLDRYTVLWKRHTKYMDRMQSLRMFCHNSSCPNRSEATKKKICECAKVAYCSRECQKIHWKKAHRKECPRSARYPIFYMPAFEPENPPPNPKLSHVHRHWLRTCALHDLASENAQWMAGRTVLIDYAGISQEDVVTRGFSPAGVEPHPDSPEMVGIGPVPSGMTRVLVRVNWGARIGADICVELAIAVAMVKVMDEGAGRRRPGIFSRPLY
ncbi:hypothetical protein FB107DRAFT_204822, partial [Schizophyllum commune]